jgi:hypothetical protein
VKESAIPRTVHRVSGAEPYGWCGVRGLTYRDVTPHADAVTCTECRLMKSDPWWR